jgi:hypothetical protein
MDERQIEELLRAHRPSGPPAYLRERITGGRVRVAPAWPWLFAAAALLTVSVGFHVSASRLRATASLNEESPTTTVTSEQRAVLRSIYGEAADLIVARAEAFAAIERRDARVPQAETPTWP